MMRASDLHKVCVDNLELLDEKKRAFITRIGSFARRNMLSGAQWQYLQSCYDLVTAKKYGIEDVGVNKDWAVKRAQWKSRRVYG